MSNKIKKELIKINEKLDKIILSVEKVDTKCTRMDEHIGFVEKTYSSVRSPLSYIKKKFEQLSGNQTYTELPQIEESIA